MAIICLVCFVVCCFLKARVGFGIDDESMYLNVPDRVFDGDCFIVDEWNLAQLFTFILYWPFNLFMRIKGSTEGVILFFRCIFVAMQSLTGCAIYMKLRKYGYVSIISALTFALHIPLTVTMSPSYYSMTPVFFILLLMCIMDISEKGYSVPRFLIAGILIALCTLSNPIIAVIFFIYSVSVLVLNFGKNKDKISPKIFNTYFTYKTYLFVLSGVVFVAAIFFVFIFSRATLAEFFENLPLLFKDPEHAVAGEDGQNIVTLVESVMDIIGINIYIFIPTAILSLMLVFDKKRLNHRKVYMPLFTLCFLAYVIYIPICNDVLIYFYWTIPLAFYGLICYALCENKNKKLFYWLWIPGVMLGICMDIMSDLGAGATAMGIIVANTASAVFVRDLFYEIIRENSTSKAQTYFKRVSAHFMIIMLIGQVLMQCAINVNFRTVCVEWDAMYSENEQLNTTLDTGPLKGIVTTENRADIYRRMMNDVDRMRSYGEGPLFIADACAWLYMYADMPYGTYTCWIIGEEWSDWGYMDRLMEYYSVHPDKKAKYVYVPYRLGYYFEVDELHQNIIEDFKENFELEIEKGEAGYILKIK